MSKTPTTAKLAVTAQPPGHQAWGQWPEQNPRPQVDSCYPPYSMDIQGLIRSYDSRAAVVTSQASLSRTTTAPQYAPSMPYTATTTTNSILSAHHPMMQPSFTPPTSYADDTSQALGPFTTASYMQPPRPTAQFMRPELEPSRGVSYLRNPLTGYIKEAHSQTHTPSIKPEPLWMNSNNSNNNSSTTTNSSTTATSTHSPIPGSKTITPTLPIEGAAEVTFKTEIDTLMKTIQAKAPNPEPQSSSNEKSIAVVSDPSFTQESMHATNKAHTFGFASQANSTGSGTKGQRKRYECTIAGCKKSFYQKTHLDIHERAHTGVKPYPCKEPGCGRSFSQLGNLKTHERRHTGERPYSCELCGKRFAQRGNVRAHRIVHNQSKPYVCRLDDCNKQFTQLGNLKSHQNKFHITTLRNLTTRFASMKDGDLVHAADKELWEYFATLYKNANKGIKGRGKDRKVGPNHSHNNSNNNNSNHFASHQNMHARYGMNNGATATAQRVNDIKYEMFDVDDEDQGSQHSVGPSSEHGTIFSDDGGSAFEDRSHHHDHAHHHHHHHNAQLAFGERIY
ncbi:hypothetical protein B7463_g10351, partial [Scytalidium lignicola]